MSVKRIPAVEEVDVEILKQSIETLRRFHERLEIITLHSQITNLYTAIAIIVAYTNNLVKSMSQKKKNISSLIDVFAVFVVPGSAVGMLGLATVMAVRHISSNQFISEAVKDGIKRVFRDAWNDYTTSENNQKELLELKDQFSIKLSLEGILEGYWSLIYNVYYDVILPLHAKGNDNKIKDVIIFFSKAKDHLQNNTIIFQEFLVYHYYHMHLLEHNFNGGQIERILTIKGDDFKKNQTSLIDLIIKEINIAYKFLGLQPSQQTTEIKKDAERIAFPFIAENGDHFQFLYRVATIMDYPYNSSLFTNCTKPTRLFMLEVLRYGRKGFLDAYSFYILGVLPPTFETRNNNYSWEIYGDHQYDYGVHPGVMRTDDRAPVYIANADELIQNMEKYSSYIDSLLGLSTDVIPFKLETVI